MSNQVGIDQSVKRDFGQVSIDASWELFFELFSEFRKLLSEKLSKKSSNQIESLLTIMISVVFFDSSQSCIQQSMHHIANKHCFFDIACLVSS